MRILKPWTRVEERRLEEAYGSMTCEELGAVFGRTALSIQARAKMLGLTRQFGRWSEEESQRVIRLYRLGWSDEEISMHMDRARSTIYYARKRLGLVGHPKNNPRRCQKIAAGKRRYHRDLKREQRA